MSRYRVPRTWGRQIVFHGPDCEVMGTVAELAILAGEKPQTVRRRLRQGWPVQRALRLDPDSMARLDELERQRWA